MQKYLPQLVGGWEKAHVFLGPFEPGNSIVEGVGVGVKE